MLTIGGNHPQYFPELLDLLHYVVMHWSHLHHASAVLQPRACGVLQGLVYTFPYNGVLLSQLYSQSMEKPSSIKMDIGITRTITLGYNFIGRQVMTREFNAIIEKDDEGYYVASVPELHGCHTQAKSLDTLMDRIKEAIALCLEVQGQESEPLKFIGVQRILVET